MFKDLFLKLHQVIEWREDVDVLILLIKVVPSHPEIKLDVSFDNERALSTNGVTQFHNLDFTWLKGRPTDCTLILGSGPLSVHSVVLAAVSPCLRTCLIDFNEKTIDLSDYHADAVKDIIEAFYTGHLSCLMTDKNQNYSLKNMDRLESILELLGIWGVQFASQPIQGMLETYYMIHMDSSEERTIRQRIMRLAQTHGWSYPVLSILMWI